MTKSVVLALAALISATAAGAAQPAAQEPQPEKKICKTERVTGSRTRTQRICMTEAEWRQLAASTKRGVEEMTPRVANGQGQAGGGG